MKLNLADKLRCSRVKRWHLLDAEQNLAEHQFNVAHIAIAVVELATNFGYKLNNILETQKNVAYLALHHDVSESLMGDLPTHVKRIDGIKDEIKKIENNFDPYVGIAPEYTDFEKWVVKIADFVDAYIYAQSKTIGSRYATNALDDIFFAAKEYAQKVFDEDYATQFLLSILNMTNGKNEHSILEGAVNLTGSMTDGRSEK